MIVCKRVLYSGRVQGVGFRWTAHQIAKGLEVSGFVKNMPNGQVELVVEGESAVVDDFLRRIASSMDGSVTDAEVKEEPPRNLHGFSVRH